MERPDFEHFIAANEYGFYCVPESFRGRKVPRLLRKGDVYEPTTLRFLARHLGDGDIVTGGAFVGDFFPALERGLAEGAQIHSFEPAPETHAAASYTIALNQLERVNLHSVAVGAEEATLHLQLARPGADEPLAAGARIVSDPGKGQTIEVPVTTLDKLVPEGRKVSILHLDVEGHEVPALSGAQRILTEHKPIVVLETGNRKRRIQYLDLLGLLAPQHKYVHTSQIEENGIFIPTA
ncbi:FkbM family methyltransferase [Pseudaestuariivita sp.]|uniref:FkbM family methyltransferase n=1 Tax=Pseudaestuariivita sp. TaxID=2211669 RepID=UPI0040587EC8